MELMHGFEMLPHDSLLLVVCDAMSSWASCMLQPSELPHMTASDEGTSICTAHASYESHAQQNMC